MSHQLMRKSRINTMMATINEAMLAGKFIDEEKFISECSLNFGAGRRYILEYLRDLENVNVITRKDGQIWTPGALKAEQTLKDAQTKGEKVNKEQKG